MLVSLQKILVFININLIQFILCISFCLLYCFSLFCLVKFLIVTSNLSDLEILHRLIYMLEASVSILKQCLTIDFYQINYIPKYLFYSYLQKSRIRKNILDFDGFGFNEDSPKYKHRMDYLNRFEVYFIFYKILYIQNFFCIKKKNN